MSDPTTPPAPQPEPASGPTEARVWEVLRTCYDPEIPVNIVDLGLVYDVVLEGAKVRVKMTLTASGCPMSGVIAENARTAILGIEGVREADVQIVWDPPWHPSMITAEGKKTLGMA
jgi:metal-sulfur cluster biosynthetic enzyme